jgi:hypothetical protein
LGIGGAVVARVLFHLPEELSFPSDVMLLFIQTMKVLFVNGAALSMGVRVGGRK